MSRRDGRGLGRQWPGDGAPTVSQPGRRGRGGHHRTARPSTSKTTPAHVTSNAAAHPPIQVHRDGGGRRGENRSRASRGSGRTASSRRSARRNSCTVLNYLCFAILLVSVANFNYDVQSSLNADAGQSSREGASTHTKTDVPSIDEKDEHFIRTGRLPGSKQMPGRSPKTGRAITGSGKGGDASSREAKTNAERWLAAARSGGRDNAKAPGGSNRTKNDDAADEYGWPPLVTLIDDDISEGADISGLLDFSIVGFPKTGTTSLLRHLEGSGLAHLLPNEHCELVVNDTVKLVREIYYDHNQRVEKAGGRGELSNELRGMKCPQDVSSDWSMHNYARFFMKTKIIVGIRHPIWWFESLYNFRVSNLPWKKMPPTSKLTKGCPGGTQGVCAWRANFHDFLSRMGKTPMSSKEEKELLTLKIKPVQSKVGKVFLYEVSQLSETKFRKDLKKFLGLERDIPPFPVIDTSGRFDHLHKVKKKQDKLKIDICMAEHKAIRSALMKKAINAATWIEDYFLKSEDVFVSDRRYFGALKVVEEGSVRGCG